MNVGAPYILTAVNAITFTNPETHAKRMDKPNPGTRARLTKTYEHASDILTGPGPSEAVAG